MKCSAVLCEKYITGHRTVKLPYDKNPHTPKNMLHYTAKAVHAHTVQCSAVQCSAVQCRAVQCSAMQGSAVQLKLHLEKK